MLVEEGTLMLLIVNSPFRPTWDGRKLPFETRRSAMRLLSIYEQGEMFGFQ
jgi:hypothetical protein